MRKTFSDQWVQLLVYTTVLSGALTALLLFAPHHTTIDASVASAAAPAAAPLTAPMPTPSLPMPAAAPSAPSLAMTPGLGSAPSGGGMTMTSSLPPGARPGFTLQGAGIMKILKAKTPGKWIVDSLSGPDSDTGDVNEALSNAKDGDEIVVLAGTYKVEIASTKKQVKISGGGSDRSKVIFENSDHNPVEVSGGSLALSNMTLRRSGGDYGSVIGVSEGTVSLTDVRIEAVGNSEGVALRDSTLKALRVQFHGGRTAVDVRERSKASLDGCSLEEHKTALLLDDKGELEVRRSTVDGGEMGIYVTKSAKLSVSDSKFTGQDQHSINLTSPGTKADVSGCDFSGSKDGLWVYEGADLSIKNSKFKDLRGEGIFIGESAKATVTGCEFNAVKTAMRVATRSTLDVVGGTIVGSNRYGVAADDSAKLALTGTTFRDNGGVSVYIERQADGVLKDVKILKTSDLGMFVGESSSASLERTTIDGSLKAGVLLGRDARFKAVASTISGNGRCALSLSGETATVTLRDAKLGGNDCAISFVEGGAVDSERGDFTGNKKGAFLFALVNKSKIALTGAGNKTKP